MTKRRSTGLPTDTSIDDVDASKPASWRLQYEGCMIFTAFCPSVPATSGTVSLLTTGTSKMDVTDALVVDLFTETSTAPAT